jgi:hypothetical protein
MKTAKFLLLIIISTSLFSCTQENLNYGSTTKETITKAQWSVDYFYAGQDLTAQFSNYKINFVGNGTVTACEGTTTVNGTWSMITDINRNDVLRINISEVYLQGLNEQWTVKQTSDDVLTMKAAGNEIHLKKL